ncbi:uncharacterized protein LOC111121424 [Crassostrea virginica]
MSYVSMLRLLDRDNVNEGDSFQLTAAIQEYPLSGEGGVSINFLAERPKLGVPSPNILFHFNPRPANRLILNSCVNGRWQQEHQVTGNDLDGMLLQTPFDLKIQILTVGDTESEFEVYINDVFLTTFRSPFPITNTMFIGFSPSIRITMPRLLLK